MIGDIRKMLSFPLLVDIEQTHLAAFPSVIEYRKEREIYIREMGSFPLGEEEKLTVV